MKAISIVVLLALATCSLQIDIKCPSFYDGLYDEQPIIDKLTAAFNSGNLNTVQKKCPELLMKRGFYDATELVIKKWFVPKKIDIVDNLRATANYLKREMEKKMKLAYNFNRKQMVHPVLKWGQNYTHTLVYVKFAHRFDSPGCLDTWGKNLTLTESIMSFTTFGIQSDQPLQFNLDFPLFESIIPGESFDKTESVGTMVLHLKKKNKGIWRYLIPPKFDSSKLNIKVWWELGDVYKKAMKSYNKMIDEEDDQKSDVTWERKETAKDRKDRKKKKKEQEEKWTRWLNTFS